MHDQPSGQEPGEVSATIVADVKRFFQEINTDEVFGTHSPELPPACAFSQV
jgi:hypothetical protein